MKFWDLEFVLLWILLLSKQDVATPPFYIAITGLIFSIGRIMTTKTTTDNSNQSTDGILNLVTRMKEDGYNFDENPAIFRWAFTQHPDLQLMLTIRSTQEGEKYDELGKPVVH